ncbi:MAG: peptidase [Allorhizobium sp.]
MKPFEIFRSGTHVDSRGRSFTFSDDDLSAIAAKYDPALSHAPIVVGHPKEDAPAYGWVKSIAFRDGKLVVEAEDIEPQFADLVKAGRFRQRSASFFPPDHPNNPKPGQYYLRHVGFLGAAAPAVKGLKAVEFSAGDDLIEFSDVTMARAAWGFEMLSKAIRGVRDFIVAEKGLDVADGILPSWQIDSIAETAQQLRQEPVQAALSYTETSEDIMNKEELERRERELAEREASFAEQSRTEGERRRKDQATADAAFVAGIVEAGKLPIGLKDVATAVFADLSDGAISFSEGDQAKTMSQRDALRHILNNLPLPVVQGELAKGDGADFSDPNHVAEAIKTEIEAARGRGETMSPAEAGMRLQHKR